MVTQTAQRTKEQPNKSSAHTHIIQLNNTLHLHYIFTVSGDYFGRSCFSDSNMF